MKVSSVFLRISPCFLIRTTCLDQPRPHENAFLHVADLHYRVRIRKIQTIWLFDKWQLSRFQKWDSRLCTVIVKFKILYGYCSLSEHPLTISNPRRWSIGCKRLIFQVLLRSLPPPGHLSALNGLRQNGNQPQVLRLSGSFPKPQKPWGDDVIFFSFASDNKIGGAKLKETWKRN